MIQANIYSRNTLTPEFKQSVSDGLDILGQHVGAISLRKTAIVRLPADEKGLVDPRLVGLTGFDYMTDLHIFAAPFTSAYSENVHGVSFINYGVAWINTRTRKRRSLIRLTAAHEAAHSFGYVLEDSHQTKNALGAHCSCKNCIMFSSNQGEFAPSTLPKDFCDPCETDMRNTADSQIGQLRMKRFITRTVLPNKRKIESMY